MALPLLPRFSNNIHRSRESCDRGVTGDGGRSANARKLSVRNNERDPKNEKRGTKNQQRNCHFGIEELKAMIISMREDATEAEIEHIIARLHELNYQAHVSRGVERAIIGAVGSGRRDELEALIAAPGVEQMIPISHPYKLVARQGKAKRSVVDVSGVLIGGDDLVLIAGPCSVESREQLYTTAQAVKSAGATMLRGGAYKPRTSPY